MKLFIFDVDGVLEKEDRLMKARKDAQTKAIAKKLNVTFKEAERLKELAKKKLPSEKSETTIALFCSFGFTRNEYFRISDSVSPKGLIAPYKRAINFLKKVSKDNRVVTYTNASKKACLATLKELKVDKYVDEIYSTERFSESKPSINNLKFILNTEGFKPKDVVVIGNSYKKDVMLPRKLGMKAILFKPGKTKLTV